MITHRISPCEALRSTARCCWATLRPETDAITAIRAVHMAMRMVRLRAASSTGGVSRPVSAPASGKVVTLTGSLSGWGDAGWGDADRQATLRAGRCGRISGGGYRRPQVVKRDGIVAL